MKRTRIRPISKKRKSRVGKVSGTVRLAGKDITPLRWQVFSRANGRCELRLDGCQQFAGWDFGEMAHTKSRGSGGADSLSNCRWACRNCHQRSHNAGGKPCPPKVRL